MAQLSQHHLGIIVGHFVEQDWSPSNWYMTPFTAPVSLYTRVCTSSTCVFVGVGCFSISVDIWFLRSLKNLILYNDIPWSYYYFLYKCREFLLSYLIVLYVCTNRVHSIAAGTWTTTVCLLIPYLVETLACYEGEVLVYNWDSYLRDY